MLSSDLFVTVCANVCEFGEISSEPTYSPLIVIDCGRTRVDDGTHFIIVIASHSY